MLISVQKFLVLSLLIVPTSCTGSDVCFDEITNSSRAVTALILARGGSKGIKLKNIRNIDGVSLLGLSLTALQEANVFETIWVSTDHQAIADEATKCRLINFYYARISCENILLFLRSSQRSLARPANSVRHNFVNRISARVSEKPPKSEEFSACTMYVSFHHL